MSSPNEPGTAHDAGSSGGSATHGNPQQSGSAPAHVADHGEVPPWQRGARARQQQPEGSSGESGRSGGQQGMDARLNRFISGGSASEPTPPNRNERTDVVRPEQGARPEGNRPDPNRADPNRPESGKYASELPDLSGPAPRPAQQRKPVERPQGEQSNRPQPPAKAVQVSTRQHSGPVRASMQIRRIDPWSTLKVSLLLSVALFFVWMIAVAFLYLVLGGMGVWTKLNSNVGDLLTSASGASGGELVSSGTIFGGAALIGLVNIVLLSAAATIGAFIYNLSTDLVGGVEVTLADRD
ncbi:MAG: DUF3566 domain-containing protein [Actinomycetota bacterium]|nr:DUF3566 domain-containing protein [Actinomycetota bacterium]